MDCVIPAHSVRPFCAALCCLSRIGKDVYVEFHPLEGLALRSINDSKSAYACFRFDPPFFQRCTAPALTTSTSLNHHRKRPAPSPSHSQESQGSVNSSSSSSSSRFTCRVSLRAMGPVIRPRKNATGLRIRSVHSSSALLLSFEFELQPKNPHFADVCLRVEHRVPVADAVGVSAVAPRDECSEIITSPRVLLRLLEPLKRTTEVSLIIRRDATLVSAASFHHSDTILGSGMANNASHGRANAVVQAAAAASSFLKTETGMEVAEFDEFHFRDDRDVSSSSSSFDGAPPGTIPPTANDEVILVFPVREARAMLQYCAHQAHADRELRVIVSFQYGGKPLIIESSRTDHQHGDHDWHATTLSSFHAELVLATLDDHLLQPMHTQTQAMQSHPPAESDG